MAYEIIQQDFLFKGSDVMCLRNDSIHLDGPPIHSAIHDIESFFWVLLYLALTCDGPGGVRRPEFDDEVEVYGLSREGSLEYNTARLQDIVLCLFDHPNKDVIATNKLRLFRNPHHMKDRIPKYISPYLRPLEGLLLDWWQLLQDSYKIYDDVEQALIHDKTLMMLDKALEMGFTEITDDPKYEILRNAELERRRQIMEEYRTFSSQFTVSSPTPSPTATTATTITTAKATDRRTYYALDANESPGQPALKKAKKDSL